MRFFVKLSLLACFALALFCPKRSRHHHRNRRRPNRRACPRSHVVVETFGDRLALLQPNHRDGQLHPTFAASGNYELTVEGPGFRKYVQSGIQVQVATTLRLDVTLQLGSSSRNRNRQRQRPAA